MATVTRSDSDASAEPVIDCDDPRIYDRSSIKVDAMVMIAGQSPEDWERFAPEAQICEYFDGIVYMPSPATDRHQFLVGFLFDLVNGFKYARGLGPVLMGPAVLRVSDQRKAEPDIFVRPREGDAPLALFVVEVLSKSTRGHDLGLKLRAYQEAGIPEVWFIDERDKAVIAEQRIGETYRRTRQQSGRLESTALPGFWIEVDWLWAEPEPNPRLCLETILNAPPA